MAGPTHACTLMVDPYGGELLRYAEVFRNLDMQLIHAPTPQQAFDVAQSSSSTFAMVMASYKALGAQAGSFLTAVKSACPELPVLWQGDWPYVTQTGPGGWEPDACITPECTNAEMLHDTAAALLREPVRTRGLVNKSCRVLVDALSEFFGLKILSCTRYRRVPRTLMADCGAVLSFAGRNAEGYVTIAAAWPTLTRTLAAMFPNQTPSVSEVEDLLCEGANRIFGAEKGVLNKYGLDLKTGLPLVVRGRNIAVKFKRSITPIVLELGTSYGTFHVECALGIDENFIPESSDAESIVGDDSGNLTFF